MIRAAGLRPSVQSRNGVDTLGLFVTLLPDGSPEDSGGCATLGSGALVTSLEVVEPDEGCEGSLELGMSSEATQPNRDTMRLIL